MPKTKASPLKGKEEQKKIPMLRESIISRSNSDKTVSIVNLEVDDICYSLDSLAAEIWTLIDGKNSLPLIRDKLIKKHHPPLKEFDSDFSKLLRKLEKENLITFL